MNEIEIFKNEEFGEVRVVEKDGEPWFVAKDICLALDLKNVTDVMSRLDSDEKLNRLDLTSLGQRGGWVVNESGLYSIVVRSDKPEAKKFRKWVTSEVLPSIRKTGGYIANQESMSPEELISQALIVANNIIAEKKKENIKLQAKIVRDQPKVEFYDTVVDSSTALNMATVAKMMGIDGFGRNKLFKYLREKKVLDSNNVSYQRYASWFNVVERPVEYGYDVVAIVPTTYVYQNGINAIRKALKKDGYFKEENT